MIPPWVAKYTGIPFRSRGRTLEGSGCYGIPYLVLRAEKGLEVPECSDGYTTVADSREIASLIDHGKTRWPWLPVGQPRCFDVVLFWLTDHYHVGLMVDRYHMLHIVPGSSSLLERVDTPFWSAAHRHQGYYRHADLT